MNPYQLLESKWAEVNCLDPKGMVACASGTAALHLGLEALYEESGEIAVPEFSMIACARAVVLAGLNPVFVDCKDDLLIDNFKIPIQVQDVMYVHIYGRICNTEERETSRFIVEDLAEAHGITPGTTTDVACWSFYKNKIVAGEEGGAVWFRDSNLADKARQLRTLGFTDQHNFLHVPRGHNYRLSNVHAELILKSLDEFAANLEKRTIVESWYEFLTPEEFRMPPRSIPWVYDLRVPGMTYSKMDSIVQTLNQEGIAARHSFKPMSMQGEFGKFGYSKLNAYRLSNEVMYFPIYPDMSYTEVTKSISRFLELL